MENLDRFWAYMEAANAFRKINNILSNKGLTYMPQTNALWETLLEKEFLKAELTMYQLANEHLPGKELPMKADELKITT